MLVTELPVSVQVRAVQTSVPYPSPPVRSKSLYSRRRREVRSGVSSYCTRQGYRVAAGGEPLTPRHAHVEHPNKTAPFHMMSIVGGQATPWSRMLRASHQGGQHLPDASQIAGEQRTAWPRKEHVGQPQVPIQLTPRPHRELQRMRTTPELKFNPPWPHPTCQCKHAWPRRDLERSGLHICRQTTYAMPARRVALGQTTTS